MRVFGFWLLQGQWDRGAQEVEGSPLAGGGHCEQVEAGFVVAGDPKVVTCQGGHDGCTLVVAVA